MRYWLEENGGWVLVAIMLFMLGIAIAYAIGLAFR